MLSDTYWDLPPAQQVAFLDPVQSCDVGACKEKGKGCYCPPFWTHRTGVFAEYMLLRPRDVEVAYGVPHNGPNVSPPDPAIQVGPTGVVDPGFSSGFRVGGSIACGCRSSVVLTYSRFENSTSDSMLIADYPLARVIEGLVLHPSVLNSNDGFLSAAAAQSIDYDLIDVDYRSILLLRECSVINWFVGARYARLAEDFEAQFSLSGDTKNLTTGIDFEGAGIRIGLDGERHHCCGLMLYGKSALSLVAGEFRSSYFYNNTNDTERITTDWKAGRIVPILDLELGVGWQSRCGRIRCTAGYQISYWFNTLTTDQWIDQVNQNNFVGQPDAMSYDTLTLDGLTGRVEFRF
jgi:hypothetical protein